MNAHWDDSEGPSFAPTEVLTAGFRALYAGMLWARKRALEGRVDASELEALMDALHDVPRQLRRWDEQGLRKLRTHLASYNYKRWNGPDLVAIFDAELDRDSGIRTD